MRDLWEFVRSELAARPTEWKQIAESVPLSYSWVYQVGSGRYKSTPNYGALQAVADYLVRTPRAENIAQGADDRNSPNERSGVTGGGN